MADKTSKTERMNISPSTERMSVDSTPTSSGDFTGSLKSGEVIKGYTVQNLISAQTGEAEIYLCIKENKQAIIKYYHPQFSPKEDILKKFHNLKHPDIITIFEYGKHNGRFYEIMEYATGGTLADKNADGKYKYQPMSESKVRKVVSEVINAFDYLHQQGIIHRDIKPGNIFYKNANGSDILIGDFGISSELDVDGGMSKRMTSTIALSDGYAAPELYGVAKDDNKAKILIGPEVDYYALGITVFELLTGTNPFSGRNALHIMRDTIEGRVADDLLSRPEAKSFSPAINTLIKGLLVVRHDKRWKYDEVSKWLNGEDVKVFNDIHIATIPPLKFGDAQITSKEELAAALHHDAELGKKYLNRGMIDNWAMKYDESFANSIIDIKESDMSDGDKLSSLIFLLDPSAPCRVSTSILINTIPEFIELLRNESELMSKIIIDRQDSDLLAWINTQSSDLYKEISKLSELFKRNPDKTDQSKLRMIYDLYINLAGDSIKPFRQNDYTVRTVNDIANVPEELQKAVVKQLLKNSSSILSQWLKNQNVTDFETVRNEMVHTWENWHAFFTGDLVKFENQWMTREQKENDSANKAEIKHLQSTIDRRKGLFYITPILLLPVTAISLIVFLFLFLSLFFERNMSGRLNGILISGLIGYGLLVLLVNLFELYRKSKKAKFDDARVYTLKYILRIMWIVMLISGLAVGLIVGFNSESVKAGLVSIIAFGVFICLPVRLAIQPAKNYFKKYAEAMVKIQEAESSGSEQHSTTRSENKIASHASKSPSANSDKDWICKKCGEMNSSQQAYDCRVCGTYR